MGFQQKPKRKIYEKPKQDFWKKKNHTKLEMEEWLQIKIPKLNKDLQPKIYLHTRNKGASKHTSKCFHPKKGSGNQRGKHNQSTRWDHCLEWSIGWNFYTRCIVRLCCSFHKPWNIIELSANLFNHFQGCTSHTLHRHCWKPVWKHCPDKQPDEDLWSQHINGIDSCSAHKSTEQSKRNESSWSNCKSLRRTGSTYQQFVAHCENCILSLEISNDTSVHHSLTSVWM